MDQAVQSGVEGTHRRGFRRSWHWPTLWIRSRVLIGLPADAGIKVDVNDLLALRDRGAKYVEQMKMVYKASAAETAPPADAEVVLVPPSREDAGPYEIDELVAIQLALENRLDLRVANGSVYDAQRKVIVAADALRTGLTLNGTAAYGGRPGARDDDIGLDIRKARYARDAGAGSADRKDRASEMITATSLINLERATRSVQSLEDQIKTAIRNELRTLLEARESLKISAQRW